MPSLSLHQQPKDREYLQCFVARPGYKLVSLDISALEPNVLAYFSRDKTLLTLYGPDAKLNDVYLFNAANSTLFGPQVRATGYDPDNPTAESIEKAKQEVSTIRKICKKIKLSFDYGASAGKIYNELLLDGVTCTYDEVKQLYADLKKLYPGIVMFQKELLRLWTKNGGWIINGRGRPLAIDDEKTKDILNRFIQSTGHDLLMLFIFYLDQFLNEAQIDWHPWLIDFHDESIVEVADHDVAAAADCFREALAEVNRQTGWDVKLTGDVLIADNLAEIKQ